MWNPLRFRFRGNHLRGSDVNKNVFLRNVLLRCEKYERGEIRSRGCSPERESVIANYRESSDQACARNNVQEEKKEREKKKHKELPRSRIICQRDNCELG